MLTKRNFRTTCLTLAFPALLAGCGGGGATASPTPTASPVATVTPTPTATVRPLGGEELSEEEKEYERAHQAAEDLVLRGDYDKAIPKFLELYEKRPDDLETSFYLMRAQGSLDKLPRKDSKAYEYAENVLKLGKDSKYAGRALAYLVSAEFSVPESFKYGKDTVASKGDFLFDTESTFKTSADIPFHTGLSTRLPRDDQATVWQSEVSPERVKPAATLPKGAEVKILGEKFFYYSLKSWEKPLNPKLKEFDDTIFDNTAYYVEVVSDGELKGKQGWILNHSDRYRSADAEDPWGAWISNRLKIPRGERKK